VGKLPALKKRHDLVAADMMRRGFAHKTDLPERPGEQEQDQFLMTVAEQVAWIRSKGCTCSV
jgi:hypothetical protein